uniref:Uncharacterized protein n=1 Tax=Aegilops tauschii subsp. strangulata TaxID=200361 RepID=A0A452XCD8_AEGTS
SASHGVVSPARAPPAPRRPPRVLLVRRLGGAAGGPADAPEGPPRRAPALRRRLEHQRQALHRLGGLQRGAGVRRRGRLARRLRPGGARGLLLPVLPRQPHQGRRLLLLAQDLRRLPPPPPRLHRHRHRRVRGAVRRAGQAGRQHVGDAALRGAPVGRRGGQPPGVRRVHRDGQGVRRRRHAARPRGQGRPGRQQGGRRGRRARRAHRQQRAQDPDRAGHHKEDPDRRRGRDAGAGVPRPRASARVSFSAVGDTCVAMEEWVFRPPGSNNSTALDDILPCADAAATTEALRRSKEVNHQLVATLNDVLANVSNANTFPPGAGPPLNYNQSGPPVPLLCSPYRADLSDRPCAAGEAPAAFAPQAWRGHVCQVSGAPGQSQEVCATPGRLTPSMYAQALAVANASAGLVGYGPVLAGLADCTFVRRTFEAVVADGCPGLRRHSGRVYRALVAVAVAVAAAVAAWVVHTRERRRRREAVRFRVSPYRLPIEDKSLLKSPRRPYRRAESGGLIGKGGW